MWQITPEIRAMVKYRQLNLLSDFSDLGTFDLIFCRNVLIYFDQETKVNVLDRLAEVIAGDGYLVLGAAETVVGLTDSFKVCPQSRGLYRPNPQRSKSGMADENLSRPRLVAVNGGR
jgi:chemotaxis protein methyltransferase CheR